MTDVLAPVWLVIEVERPEKVKKNCEQVGIFEGGLLGQKPLVAKFLAFI